MLDGRAIFEFAQSQRFILREERTWLEDVSTTRDVARQVEYISAPDFCTLGWSKGMQTLRLWRLFQMRDELRRMGA